MRIGLAIFAYCRKEHLIKVLEGLKQNEAVDTVYFFQDGLKCETDRVLWEETAQVICRVNWCKKKVIIAEKNKGLSQSIIDGIQIVLEENDAVIVLEDDCVPKPSFVAYMKQCFAKYADDQNVFSIAGYSWPIKLEKGDSDIYFCGRPCSWGWGTWKDRWKYYVREANLIIDIKKDKEASKRLATWGDDLENMLVNNYLGYNDSWYVYWALLMIRRKVYAVNPYVSLIDNIGFDGTGVHCGVTNRFDVYSLDNRAKNAIFCLDDKVIPEKQVEKAFVELYGNYSVLPFKAENPIVLVYGLGKYYKRNAEKVCAEYTVCAFVDKWKKDKFYAGIEIIHPRRIQEKEYDFLLIMIENIQVAQEVQETLVKDYGIDSQKIIIGREKFL